MGFAAEPRSKQGGLKGSDGDYMKIDPTLVWSGLPFLYDIVSSNGASFEPRCYTNLTGQRMHVEGPQIYKINRQTNSFQNMCDTL